MSDAVRHGITVACPQDHAFVVFTTHVDRWWPASHRRLPASSVTLEPGEGGRLVERGPDGTELEIGTVLRWDPPHGLDCAWRLGAPPAHHTTVAIRFTADGAHTRVDVVHTPAEPPLPDWVRTAAIFERAWQHVLASFQSHVHQELP